MTKALQIGRSVAADATFRERLSAAGGAAAGGAAFAGAAAIALLGLNAGAEEPAPEREAPARTVELQLLGVNDLHGHLEPPEPRARRGGLARRPSGA